MLLAFFHLGDGHRTPSGRNRALFLLSAAGYAVSSTPDFARLDAPLRFPLLVASLGVPALLWISAAAVFDDKFEPSWRRGLAWVGLVVLGLWSVFDSQPPVTIGYYAVSLLFVAVAAWHALGGWRTEPIDARPRLLAPLTVAGALYAATIEVADFAWPGSTLSAPFSLANSIGLAIIAFCAAMC